MLHVRPRWLRLLDAVAAATGRLSTGGNGVVASGAHPAAPAAAPLEDLWHVHTPEPQVGCETAAAVLSGYRCTNEQGLYQIVKVTEIFFGQQPSGNDLLD